MIKEIVLAIAIFVMVIVVAVVGALNIENVPIFNLVLLAGLIGVTTWYAYSTIKIARATEKQAAASVKMAEATEKSVTEMVRPMVLPSVTFGHSQDTASSQYSIDKMCASFKNTGRGPALHVEAKIHHPDFGFEGPLPKIVLEVGEEVPLYIYPSSVGESKSQERFEVIAKYQDIYGKWFCSRLTQDEHGQYHLEYGELERKGND